MELPTDPAPGAVRRTEESNPASSGIDMLSSREILEVIHLEDRRAWESIGGALESISRLVDLTVAAFRRGGRLIYLGAGTSGRLGVLDAAECPPTFGVGPDLVLGIIAGGEKAMRTAVEGAEDSVEEGAASIRSSGCRDRDVVCGIASSGSTPFVVAGLEEAARRDASTAIISCNPPGQRVVDIADVVIELPVGPEVIAGSTRMKGGTATKMVLNMITTAAMIRWGKVYDNLMVDLRPTNQKLVRRAIDLVARIGGIDTRRAGELFHQAGQDVKTAIVMGRLGVEQDQARRLLEDRGGILRKVIGPGAPGD